MKNEEKNKKKYDNSHLAKALYKVIMNKMKKGKHYKDDATEVIRDILDPNYVAQVDPDEIPPAKTRVTMKSEKNTMTVHEAVEAIQGDRDVDDILPMVSREKRSAVLKQLRSRMEKGKLSESCKAKLRAKFDVYPSAVANLNAGRVCGTKKSESNQIVSVDLDLFKSTQELRKSLRRWVKERWTNEDGQPCGSGDKGSSQKCRPSKKVNSKTPETWGSMDSKEKKKAVRQKRKATKEGKKYANHNTGKTYGKR